MSGGEGRRREREGEMGMRWQTTRRSGWEGWREGIWREEMQGEGPGGAISVPVMCKRRGTGGGRNTVGSDGKESEVRGGEEE